MRALFSWPIVVFFAAIGLSSLMFGAVKLEYGQVDFFQKHGYAFLVFITFFPRLTLLFSSVPTGGIFWWLGWLFYPRLTVAILATVAYLQTNPVLVYISWFVAISGEVLEKKGISANKRFIVRRYSAGGFNRGPKAYEPPPIDKSGVIEAEFTKKD